VNGLLRRFEAGTLLLHDFLLEEVFAQQSDTVQSFLMRTALLDRFTLDLAWAIVGGDDVGRAFESVARSGLFLHLLDEDANWNQFHQIFGAFLRREAHARLSRAEIRDVYRRASTWHEQQALISDAVTYGVAAEDWERVTSLVRTLAEPLVRRGDVANLLAWFEALPPTVIGDDAYLSSLYAWAIVISGRTTEAEQALEAAEQVAAAAGDLVSLAVVTVGRAEMQRLRSDGDGIKRHAERTLALLQQIEAEAPPTPTTPARSRPSADPQELRTTIDVYLSASAWLAGRPVQAEDSLQLAREQALTSGWNSASARAAVELGHTCLQQGRLNEAADLCLAVLAAGEVPHSELRHALLMLAEIAYERNQLDDMERRLTESQALTKGSWLQSWTTALHRLGGQLAAARGDSEAALECFALALEAAHAHGNERAASAARALAAQTHLARGDLGKAIEWAQQSALRPDDVPDYTRFYEQLAQARVLIAQGEPADAHRLLSRLLSAAFHDGRYADVLRILVSIAIVEQELMKRDRAITALNHALELAEPGGYLRVFVDEGQPLVRLLKAAQRRATLTDHAQQMLVELGEPQRPLPKFLSHELVEPITAREIEVLELLASGLPSTEIADELYISLATVKRHIANLYGKLGVASRAEALQRARQIGLLPQYPAVSVAGADRDIA